LENGDGTMNTTISYYERWLGCDGCLTTTGLQFIETVERDKVQPGYADAFDLYVWRDTERMVVSYGNTARDYVNQLQAKLAMGQSIADVKEILSEVFGIEIKHNVKYIFNALPEQPVAEYIKTLTLADYHDFETFFRSQHPNAKDISWLPEYFAEMVAEHLCVGVYEDGKVVCCTDAPLMPYLIDVVQEIGVNTLADYRQKGYAAAACQQMVANILANGKAPQWSTSIDNVGSQRLAERVGFQKLADILTISGL
jgi:RimJ/RimL family protein N-acetyltransferase